MNKIEGDFKHSQGRYALLVSRWNSFVVEHLKDGAIDTLQRHGINPSDITVVYAPGAFEFPWPRKNSPAPASSTPSSPSAPSFAAAPHILIM